MHHPTAKNKRKTNSKRSFFCENVEMCRIFVAKINEQLNLPETRQFLVKII